MCLKNNEIMNALSKLHAILITWSGERISHRISSFKSRFFSGLSGQVVEIGPGGGTNIQFMPKNVVSYIGVEPNATLRKKINGLKIESTLQIRCLDSVAENIPIPDNYADAVISTFVLCSVRRQDQTLAEVIRVLKPGKPFLFIEHVAATSAFSRRLQNVLTPCSRIFCAGCEWNRPTGDEIKCTGFTSVDLRDSRAAGLATWRPLGPIIFGTALK